MGQPDAQELRPGVPERPTAASALGTVEGALRGPRQGDDPRTPRSRGYRLWAEQLIAESTGKEGKGIIPSGRAARLRLTSTVRRPPFRALRIGAMRRSISSPRRPRGRRPSGGRLRLEDKYDLAAEFFRWEFATAVAGAHLGIDAFDEPNVQERRTTPRRCSQQYEQTGSLPEDAPRSRRRAARVRRRVGHQRIGSARRASRHRELWRLRRADGLRDPRRRDYEAALQHLRVAIRDSAGRHHARIRPPLPAQHRAVPQGWPQHRRVHPNHAPTTARTSPFPGEPYTFSVSSSARRPPGTSSRCAITAGASARHIAATSNWARSPPTQSAQSRRRAERSHTPGFQPCRSLCRARPHGRQHGVSSRRGRDTRSWCSTGTRRPSASTRRHSAGPRRTLDELVARSSTSRAASGSWCRREDDRGHLRRAAVAARARRHDHRRRQLELPRLAARAPRAAPSAGIGFVDAGASGGIWGLEVGYCLMVGGDEAPSEHCEPDLHDARAAGRLRARRARRRRPLREDGAQRHRVRHARRRTPRASRCCEAKPEFRPRPARDRAASGTTAVSCARGCSSCAERRSSGTRSWTGSRATSRTRARGAGRSRRRCSSTCRRRCITAVALSALPSRAGRVVRGQGDRRAAQRVRRARGEERTGRLSARRRHHTERGTSPLPERLPGAADTGACCVVIFGACGDLTRRKLMPALYASLPAALPGGFAIVGVGAQRGTDDDVSRADARAVVRSSLRDAFPPRTSGSAFAAGLRYVAATLRRADGMRPLGRRSPRSTASAAPRGNRLFYFAVPPGDADPSPLAASAIARRARRRHGAHGRG